VGEEAVEVLRNSTELTGSATERVARRFVLIHPLVLILALADCREIGKEH
jgi:hypothetical protein